MKERWKNIKKTADVPGYLSIKDVMNWNTKT